MNIQGVQRLSLLDFPDRVACTVFTCGCNFRCPFCHNASLVVPGEMTGDEMAEDVFFDFLASRMNKLDGVCITGGEPLLQRDIGHFIRRIRSLGFAVKLDTNGSVPGLLKELVGAGLIDYVAMDIKNSPGKYAETSGIADLLLEPVFESVSFLLSGKVPYEFRTTVIREYHTGKDIEQIGRWIQGAPLYYLQEFVDSGSLIGEDLHASSPDEMEAFRRIAADYVPGVQLRGV